MRARFISLDWRDFDGEALSTCVGPHPEAEIRRVVDPGSAVKTIHWGRNYIYEAAMKTPTGIEKVVVKQFRNHGMRRRLERRLWGSKAKRSWHVLNTLLLNKIDTPGPVMLLESKEPDGNSYFVTRLLEPAYEVRHFFRRLNGAPDAMEFPDVEPLGFLRKLGALARRLHDKGIWYRDLSLGNVLAHPDERGDLRLFLVDFNRAKVGRRLGLWRRSRDICRFPILEKMHREAFLDGYWGVVPNWWHPRWWLYVVSVRSYLLKHAFKNRLRRKGATAKPTQAGRHHPHIPAAEAGASKRDLTVWDHLSDQPHQHASKWQKMRIRLADGPEHLADIATVLAAAPRIYRRYRRLREDLYTRPVPFRGIGISVRPCPEKRDDHLQAILDLGVKHVLLRLHPWQDEHRDEEELARRLVENGRDVSFVLAQNRDLVRDPERWRASIEELAEIFTPFGRHFQVGHAVNRSKWGVWSSKEYAGLYHGAAQALKAFPGVEILGPGVIDFEFQSTAAYLNRRKMHFDAVASLLYVDRRGAPENTQIGLDTVGKVTLLKAICDTARNSESRSWITEVNWPLWEGPHSPAGRAVSVDEETQADYLARYFLLALGTGLVERVYWWRLVARGYGLAVLEPDGSLRRRPSFSAMRTLVDQLQGAHFIGPHQVCEGSFVYTFDGGDSIRIAAWAKEPGTKIKLPGRPVSAVDRDGMPFPVEDPLVELGPSPTYYRIQAE